MEKEQKKDVFQLILFNPFGRVFDDQSLDLINGASVTLLMKRENSGFTPVTPAGIMGGSIINPQTVVEDGMFSFIVPDGSYKLSVSGSCYRFPVIGIDSIHPNYIKIYSDIYPALTGEEIIQVGIVQHHNIPLLSLGASTNNPPVMIEKLITPQPTTKKLLIKGKVSHPMTKLIFYTTLIKKVEAQTAQATTVRVEPIPTYLEGYAYNDQGEIIPNATVGVYLTFSQKPYSETKADGNGFFKISSEYLPRMPYELRYTTPTGRVIKITTSQFIAQNKNSLIANNTNMYVYKNQQDKTLAQRPVLSPTVPKISPTLSQPTNNFLLLLAVLIFLILTVGVILVVYLIKKKKTETSMAY